ncbi:hypothetical protein TNCV_1717131 [Trichonephila clavipes]|nr:hypothetical protein TNCV_1717131 [Trichonephila clavipes]
MFLPAFTLWHTAGSHFSQPPVRPSAVLLSLHLMDIKRRPCKCFSFMGTVKRHTELMGGGVEARQCEFWRGTLLPIGIEVLVRCHADDTSRHSPRTEAIYDEWIPLTSSSRSV